MDELLDRHRLVINCSGVGARTLRRIRRSSIRGNWCASNGPKMNDTMVFDEGDDHLVRSAPPGLHLGGTAQNDDWNLNPTTGSPRKLCSCAALRPELAGARILGHLVGLRPGRPPSGSN